ncbi:MAG: DUF5916 domain-containing protein [Pseudohongiella sp.]|nr:DUF5916 domain-containing protein [Pseudohongiella sp.]
MRFVRVLCLLLPFFVIPVHAQTSNGGPSMVIPVLSSVPQLSDFVGMTPATAVARQMTRVDSFIQREPIDGVAGSQRTEVYLGYDQRTLYAIFLAFDNEPQLIRANLSSRESIDGDDSVELTVDTFNDQRTAYSFRVTPLGIQRDARWSENRDFDVTWDAAWQSDGLVTDQGYMVRIAVPLTSIRFPAASDQVWRVQFGRQIPRLSEQMYWPAYSTRQQSRLGQAALMTGIRDVAPGSNSQFVPYAFSRAANTLDRNAAGGPKLKSATELELGLDAKFVVRDAWVLDLTLNPDFSQVESDLPQVTVNERFEVLFPERRPFFVENADFFKPTDANLLFTRRIVDPEAGLRFTGRQNGWGFGAMLMNDEAPGLNRAATDPLYGEKARIGVIRGFRDLQGQNRIGAMVTERQLADGYNRVAGVDGRFVLNANWTTIASAYRSEQEPSTGGNTISGVQRDVLVEHRGRKLTAHIHAIDTDRNFRSELGFQNRWYRSDTSGVHSFFNVNLYPEQSILTSWGPRLSASYQTDQSGVKIYSSVGPSVQWNFNTTRFNVSVTDTAETLRPIDFRGLPQARVYDYTSWGVQLVDESLSQVTLDARYNEGEALNIVPAAGNMPSVADNRRVDLSLLWRPIERLRVDNTYLNTSLKTQQGVKVFDNEILRSSWNYQFTKEISLRLIAQYEETNAGPATRLVDSKNLNFDVLLRYVINPLSAFYLGFNSNARNFDIVETATGRELIASDSLTKDGEQVFVKFSYLFQR